MLRIGSSAKRVVLTLCSVQMLVIGARSNAQSSSSSVDFGAVLVGDTGPSKSISVELSKTITLGSIDIEEADFTDFEETSEPNCPSGDDTQKHVSCTVEVRFSPETIGKRSGKLLVKDSAGHVILTRELLGSGIAESLPSGSALVSQMGGTSVSSAQKSNEAMATQGAGKVEHFSSPSLHCRTWMTASSTLAGACTTQDPSISQADTLNPAKVAQAHSLGSTSSTMSVPVILSTGGVLSNIAVLTQGSAGLDFVASGGGNCSIGASYNIGDMCTVNVAFAPTYPGGRYGAVVLTNSSGNVLGTGYVQAAGVSPQVNFLPGVESTISTSSLSYPGAIVSDGKGNLYIADTGNNRILEETLSASGYAESTVPTSVLNDPSGIAIDGAGNLYIADSGNSRILKETLSGSSYTETAIETSDLNWPIAVAADGNGNIYILDAGDNQLLKETLSGSRYTESLVSTSALNWPSGLAVDSSGTVYIADSGNGRVLVETYSGGGYVESTVTSSTAAYPTAVSIDGVGAVYVLDGISGHVSREVQAAGTYTETFIPTSTFNWPSALAIQGSGDALVVDSGAASIFWEQFSAAPTLTFVPTAPGATSNDSPQTVTVANVGNGTLSFLVPASGNNPSIAADFTLNSGETAACPRVTAGSSAGSLAAGQTCVLQISFSPADAGAVTGSVILADDALNTTSSAQTIPLNGTGTGSTAQSITFSAIPSQQASATIGLAATASSGLAVRFASSTPSVCAVSGATAVLAATGTCTVVATQPGNETYTAATPVTQSFFVNLVPQAITFAAIPNQVANMSVPVALTATANSGLQVTFTSSTPSVCAVSDSTATVLSAGACTIQASQPGDGMVYAAATPVVQSFTVQTAGEATGTSFGPTNVGTSSNAVTVSVAVSRAGAPGSVSVVTQGVAGLDFAASSGGSCASGNSYNVGDTCTVNVVFTPKSPGTRNGAVVLADASGNVLGTAYVQGSGTGPMVSFLPGTQSMITTSSLSYPDALVIDASGNVYIADSGNNRILKETLSAGNYTESVFATSTLSEPAGMAIDGAGNLYIADSGNNRILKETLSGSRYTETTVPTSDLNWPLAIAIDGSGNLYIADDGNNRVVVESQSSGATVESAIAIDAHGWATGIAVDVAGNLYIADMYNNRVLKETLAGGSYTESSVTTSTLSYPNGVTVDVLGNLVIADTGNGRILKETLSAGSYVESVMSITGLSGPVAAAIDGSGNLFVVDPGSNQVVKEAYSLPGNIAFGGSIIGVTSNDSPQTLTVINIGNGTLQFPVPTAGSNPAITENFSLDNGSASSCPQVSAGASSAGTLQAGQSCVLSVSFNPTEAGTVTGSAVLTDNSLNATSSTQTIQLSGTGTGSTAQTITFPALSTQQANTTIALMATASSGLAVVFKSSTSLVCTVAGSTATLIAAGTCTIQANQAGNETYAAAPSVTQSFTVGMISQSIAFAAIPNQVANASVPVMLTATASSGLAVAFASSTPSVCTVSDSTATLVSAGICTIRASQNGDGAVFAAAAPVAQSFAVKMATGATAQNLGSVNVGSASSPVVVQVHISAAGVLGDISVVTQGATGLDFTASSGSNCATGASYNAGDTCTVSVVFTPAYPGVRYGAIVLSDTSGSVLGRAFVQGIGVGPQVNFLPGTELSLAASALSYPAGIAIDGSGNLYVVDAGNNRVLMQSHATGSASFSSIPTSPLEGPRGIAVDGSGALYIADSYNNRILKETPYAGSFVESTVPTSTLSYPLGVAVDGAGNLYIADTYNQRIVVEQPSGGLGTETILPTSPLSYPFSVAVDAQGNVYIADTYSSRILKETLSSGAYTESLVPTSTLSYPSGVSVDALGNLLIADTESNRVLKETLTPSGYVENILSTSPLNWPSAAVADSLGSVYIADPNNSRILREQFGVPSALTFIASAPGSTSGDSPQTVTVENVGNAVLAFPAPMNGTNPSVAADFGLLSSATSACPIETVGGPSGTLAIGQSCVLQINFTPVDAGTVSGSVVLTDSGSNGALSTQTIPLSGTGTGSTAQTINFPVIPAQQVASTIPLTASASSGLAVVFTSGTPSTCSVSGAVATLTTAGTCTIRANQYGSVNFAAAPTVMQSFTISLVPQTITFTMVPDQVASASMSLTLTATVDSGLTVAFASSTPSVCTVSGSTAALLSVGTCTIVATQPGDGVVYATANSVTQSFTVQSAIGATASNFGSVNVGSSTGGVAVRVPVSTFGVLASISVVTQGATGLDFAATSGGNCASGTSYGLGDSCTVNVVFTPMFSGARRGAIVLVDTSGNTLGTAYLQGMGAGPELNFLPGTKSTLSSNQFGYTAGIAIDGFGNLYIADCWNNRIVKETLSAGSYTESTVDTSPLNYPYGVAIDGAGNLYIVDSGNNRVLKETPSGNSYIETTVETSGLNVPLGIAVDGGGNLYITDDGNNRALKETPQSGGYAEVVLPTSALNDPEDIAVDGSGNVYIADSGNSRVVQLSPSGEQYVETAVTTSGLNFPYVVAIDGANNLYIQDAGRLLEEVFSSYGSTERVNPVGSDFSGAHIVFDTVGNLYGVDEPNGSSGLITKYDLVHPANLVFGIAPIGTASSDSPQSITLLNNGSGNLQITVPDSGSNPSVTTNFSLDGGQATACPIMSSGSPMAAVVAAKSSCTLYVSFTPTASGAASGILSITDATSSGASRTQVAQLSGTGGGTVAQSIAFSPLTATPVWDYVSLLATATSNLQVSFTSITPDMCIVQDLGNQPVVTAESAGTCSVVASQPGNEIYSPANPVTQSFLVTRWAQTIHFAAIPTQVINPSVPLALSVWSFSPVASNLPITLTSLTPSVCTVSNTDLTATLLAVGTCAIQADQLGDTTTLPAASVTQSFSVELFTAAPAVSIGSYNVGSTSAATLVNLVINTSGTLGNAVVSTLGASDLDFGASGTGTCVVGTSYNAGDTCTLGVIFAPKLPGVRYGAVLVYDESGSLLATTYLQGLGIAPLVAFSPGTESQLGVSTLGFPAGIAVDGSGNVYIADSTNNRILKETPSTSGYTETTVSTSSLTFPYGVAIDGGGNLYIADTGNSRVLKETPNGAGYVESTLPTSTLNNPFSVAVDGGGTVYVADTYNNRVVMETPSGENYTETLLPTSTLNFPTGVAVDSHGSVFVADSSNGRVLRESPANGQYVESELPTSASEPFGLAMDSEGDLFVTDLYGNGLGAGQLLKEAYSSKGYTESVVTTHVLSQPFGIASDGHGNLYVTDFMSSTVMKEDLAGPPALSFATTAVGATSADSPQTVTVTNIGNLPLTVPIPSGGTNPAISPAFALNGDTTAACPLLSAGAASAALLAVGKSCVLSISFMPTEAGMTTGAVVITDNSLNAGYPSYSQQSISLTGTGQSSAAMARSVHPLQLSSELRDDEESSHFAPKSPLATRANEPRQPTPLAERALPLEVLAFTDAQPGQITRAAAAIGRRGSIERTLNIVSENAPSNNKQDSTNLPKLESASRETTAVGPDVQLNCPRSQPDSRTDDWRRLRDKSGWSIDEALDSLDADTAYRLKLLQGQLGEVLREIWSGKSLNAPTLDTGAYRLPVKWGAHLPIDTAHWMDRIPDDVCFQQDGPTWMTQ